MVIFSKDKSPANVNRGKGWTPETMRRWLKYYGQKSDLLPCWIAPNATAAHPAPSLGVLGMLWSRAATDDSEQIVCRTTAAVSFTAQADGDADKLPTFTIRAYNGGIIRPRHWGRVVIDLAGLKAAEPIAILLDHELGNVVGQSLRVAIGERAVDIAGVITGNTRQPGDPAEKVVTHARNGFKWRASVGIDTEAIEDIAADVAVEVNGRTFKGPFTIVRKGTLYETSFVSAGADTSSYARVAARG